MADGQYVEDTGNGYNVVDNGQVIGSYSDLNAAQDAYNAATGGEAFQPYGSPGADAYGGGLDPQAAAEQAAMGAGAGSGNTNSQPTYGGGGGGYNGDWSLPADQISSASNPYPQTGGSAISDYFPLISIPGAQAPINQTNYTIGPDGMMVHAPGQAAPVDQHNLTNMPNQMSPGSFAAISLLGSKDNSILNGQSGIVPNGDGTFSVYAPDASGNIVKQVDNDGNSAWTQDFAQQVYANAMQNAGGAPPPTPTPPIRTAPQPLPGGAAPSSGGKSLDQMTSELRAAGYNGPWDANSIMAAYKRTVNGGNAPTKDPSAGINAQVNALMQAQIQANQAAMAQQQANFVTQSKESQLNNLLSQAKSYPGAMTAINQLMSDLGLPPITTGAQLGSTGIMPNQINPAQWDAMPQAAKALILAAYEATGGNPADFTAGIDAQRPAGRGSTSVATSYAGLH